MGLTVQTFERTREATAALERDDGLRILGGGTLVVRSVNEGDIAITGLVRCKEAASNEIQAGADRIQLGAGTTMSQVADHEELGWLAPAAKVVGGPAVRNMATVGGNLYASAPFGDFGVALLALDAVVSVHAGFSSKDLPIAEFYAARDAQWRLGVVTAVSFHAPALGSFRFRKVSRIKPKGAAVVTLAAVLSETAGRISQARIAYGAMAATPMRAERVEQELIGRRRTAEGIAPALAMATEGTDPADDPICSAWYRHEVLPVHLSRLLLD
jgi:CO/xanthine dehydrogenase FAD-binding subunit